MTFYLSSVRLAGLTAAVLSASSCVPPPAAPPPAGSLPPRAVAAPRAMRGEIVLVGAARQGSAILGQAPENVRALTLDGRPVAMARDGAFMIAFDRDAPSSALLVATGEDGREVRRTIAVAPADWRIEHVDASITAGVPSAEYQRRRSEELDRINAARTAMRAESSAGWRQAFIWPVVARISGRFGSQRIYRGTPGSYHSGVDLAGGAGTTYVAPADGVVILVADHPYTLEGNLLMVDHGMGLSSAFLHSQRILVKVGDVVRRGQPLGIIGATGRVTGPHLHWGMKWNDARIDPVTMVSLPDPDPR